MSEEQRQKEKTYLIEPSLRISQGVYCRTKGSSNAQHLKPRQEVVAHEVIHQSNRLARFRGLGEMLGPGGARVLQRFTDVLAPAFAEVLHLGIHSIARKVADIPLQVQVHQFQTPDCQVRVVFGGIDVKLRIFASIMVKEKVRERFMEHADRSGG